MDDKLTRVLQSLPRREARPGFTDAVWRRIDEGESRRHRVLTGWPMRLAVAAACLSLLVLGAREWWHYHERKQTAARLAALEIEYRALSSEIESLRSEMSMAQGVVYLGGDNDLDLVLDLAQLQRLGVRPDDLLAGWSQRLAPDRNVSMASDAGHPNIRPAHFEQPRKPTIY